MSYTQVQFADPLRSGYYCSDCDSDEGSTTTTDSTSTTSNNTTTTDTTTTTNGCLFSGDSGTSKTSANTTNTTNTTTANGGPFSDDPYCLMVYVDDEMTACENHLRIILQQRNILPQNDRLAEQCAEDVKKAEAELRQVAAFARDCRLPWAYVFGGRNFGEGAKAARKEQEAKLRGRLCEAMHAFEADRLRCERTRGMVVAIRRALEALGERANEPWGVVSELRERQVEVYRYSDAEICIKVRHEGEPPRAHVLRAHERVSKFWEEQKQLLRDVVEMERVLVSTAAKCAVATGEVRRVMQEKGLDAMRETDTSENGCETRLWGSLWAASCSRMRFW
ncbi:hypothetical protein CKAH01_01781 [Colletotrichum kahawae]|uniref:Uncharacterized protein n=1 Tax=Colletotrichum kahawae TaxID=34407 RepID=A0AAD9Y4U2_COLKA|nr:hypothetical protein CKAH01_01781 [Colletotrichum kahawae]